MLKEQLLQMALKTLTQAHGITARRKKSLSGQLAQICLKNFAKIMTAFSSRSIIKKPRKSSIRPAKEIGSSRAQIIVDALKKYEHKLLSKEDEIHGKRSLAYLVWALGQAERAGIREGISVHDVSALLYRACNIELYPINISRVVYGNKQLVQQSGQLKRTKTYILTKEGKTLFSNRYNS